MAKDAEIVIGTGKLVGLFVALVVVGALIFGYGYSMGRGATVSATSGSSPAVVVLGQRDAAKSPASSESSTTVQPAAATEETTERHTVAGGQYFLQVAAVTKQE